MSEKRKAGGNAIGAAKSRAKLREYIIKGKEAQKKYDEYESDDEESEDEDEVVLTQKEIDELTDDPKPVKEVVKEVVKEEVKEAKPTKEVIIGDPTNYEYVTKSINDLANLVKQLQEGKSKDQVAISAVPTKEVREKTNKQIQEDALRAKILASFLK